MMAPLRDGVSNAAVVSAKLKLFVFGGTTIHRDKASKVRELLYLIIIVGFVLNCVIDSNLSLFLGPVL